VNSNELSQQDAAAERRIRDADFARNHPEYAEPNVHPLIAAILEFHARVPHVAATLMQAEADAQRARFAP
jgi:hypothetical protein